jgi:hypothetical protein
MILMRENPLLGPLEGVSPDNLDFLGPNGTHFACCHFRAQKSLNFQGHPFQWLSKWIFPHQNHYVQRHINNRYINSYFHTGKGWGIANQREG